MAASRDFRLTHRWLGATYPPMAKKANLLLATVAVLVLAVPAIAKAGTFTSKPGILTPLGTKFIATSTNFVLTTPLGNTTCAHVELTAEVTKNTGGTVEGIGVGTGVTKTCLLVSKVVVITDLTLRNFKSTSAGKGTVSITFEEDKPGGLVCHYEGTAVPFTYTSGSDSINFAKAALTATPVPCGPAALDADFTLTIAGSPLIFD